MFWIIFLSFSSIPEDVSTDNPVNILDVPPFAEGKEFQTLDQCQRFLTDGFLEGKFPELQNDERRWQLVQFGRTVEGMSHEHNENVVFSYRITCVKNPIEE